MKRGKEEYDNKIDATDRDLISKFEIDESNKIKISELLNKTSDKRQEIFTHIRNNIWPLMDRNKQLKDLDGYYYSMTEYEKDTLNIVPFEEPIDFSSLESSALFKGYIGEVIYAINASMFNGLSANTLKRKNELSVYFYAMDKNNYENIPLDYFTGEGFKVGDFPDRIEIDVHTNSRLDSPKKYVIQK